MGVKVGEDLLHDRLSAKTEQAGIAIFAHWLAFCFCCNYKDSQWDGLARPIFFA
jgi:hypothetical protein